jgi:hypothetical protein
MDQSEHAEHERNELRKAIKSAPPSNETAGAS